MINGPIICRRGCFYYLNRVQLGYYNKRCPTQDKYRNKKNNEHKKYIYKNNMFHINVIT